MSEATGRLGAEELAAIRAGLQSWLEALDHAQTLLVDFGSEVARDTTRLLAHVDALAAENAIFRKNAQTSTGVVARQVREIRELRAEIEQARTAARAEVARELEARADYWKRRAWQAGAAGLYSQQSTWVANERELLNAARALRVWSERAG